MINTEEQALLHTILENPAEDTPRLVLADWLDEQDEVRVKCPHCRGSKKEPGTEAWIRYRDCEMCSGLGTVIDTSRRDRGEFIRLSIEAARLDPDSFTIPGQALLRQLELDRQVDALLRTHEAAWRRGRVCGRCDGRGETGWLGDGDYPGDDIPFECRICYGIGYMGVLATPSTSWRERSRPEVRSIKAEWTRGFLHKVTLTTEQFMEGSERVKDVGECEQCRGTGNEYDGREYAAFKRCPTCKGTGRKTVPDSFAARLFAEWPITEVALSGLTPRAVNDSLGNGFCWSRNANNPHVIPGVLHDFLPQDKAMDIEDGYVRWEREVDAFAALSAACVLWGRKQAVLPELKLERVS